MNKAVAVLGGASLGAGLLFFMDPKQGRRRRALVRDKAVSAWNDVSGTVSGKSQHLADKARGVAARTSSAIRQQSEGGSSRMERAEGGESRWNSPTTRLVVGAAGGVLAVYGISHRGAVGKAAKTIGAGLLSTTVGSRGLGRLIRMAA